VTSFCFCFSLKKVTSRNDNRLSKYIIFRKLFRFINLIFLFHDHQFLKMFFFLKKKKKEWTLHGSYIDSGDNTANHALTTNLRLYAKVFFKIFQILFLKKQLIFFFLKKKNYYHMISLKIQLETKLDLVILLILKLVQIVMGIFFSFLFLFLLLLLLF